MSDPDCLFCKIIAGTLHAIKVHEDDAAVSIMDIMPQAPGHVLVLPKAHGGLLWEIPADAAAAMTRHAQRVAKAVRQALDAPGIMLMQLNGAAAGQSVLTHVHLHILPRFHGLDLKLHARDKADPAALQAMAEKIRAALRD